MAYIVQRLIQKLISFELKGPLHDFDAAALFIDFL